MLQILQPARDGSGGGVGGVRPFRERVSCGTTSNLFFDFDFMALEQKLDLVMLIMFSSSVSIA